MKTMLEVCLLGILMTSLAVAQQDPSKPVPRPGVTVQMPVSKQAVQMQEADQLDATVVAITADGKLFVGTRPAQLSDIAALNAPTVYVKADARVPFQNVLLVLDALRGHTVVLLTAPTSQPAPGTMTWPYGVKVTLGADQLPR